MTEQPRSEPIPQKLGEGIGRPGYRVYVLLLLLVVHIFSFLDRTLLGILAPSIKRDLSLSDSMLGIMTGLSFALLYTSASVPISFLADRFNRARILALALSFWSLSTSACGLAIAPWQLFAARMAVGVGEAGGTAPAHAIITDYFPRSQRGRAFSIYSFGVPLGSGLGMLLGAFLTVWLSWRAAFLIIGLLGLPVALLVSLTVREPRQAVTHAIEAPLSFLAAARTIGAQLAFWFISLGGAFSAMMSYGLVFWMPSFLHRSHGMAVTTVALTFGLVWSGGGVSGNILGGWAGDRLAQRFGRASHCIVAATGFALTGPFVLAAMLVETPWIMFACLLAPALASGAAQPTIISAIQQIATTRTRAVASAMMMFVNTLIGLALGTALLGIISDQFAARFGSESLRYAILSCSIFYVIASVLLFLGAWSISGNRGQPRASETRELTPSHA